MGASTNGERRNLTRAAAATSMRPLIDALPPRHGCSGSPSEMLQHTDAGRRQAVVSHQGCGGCRNGAVPPRQRHGGYSTRTVNGAVVSGRACAGRTISSAPSFALCSSAVNTREAS